MNNKELLWKQSIEAPKPWLNLGMSLVFGTVALYFFGKVSYYYAFTHSPKIDFVDLIELLSFFVIAFFWLYTDAKTVFISTTIFYYIYADYIAFEWGYRKKQQVCIPFSDIVSINLVQYEHNKESTIYFYTKSDYKLHRINFDSGDARHTPTFEKILDGQSVYDLLMKQWKATTAINS